MEPRQMKVLALLVALALPALPQTVFFGAPQTATVTVNLVATGYTIPSNFVGWSVENQDLIGGYYDGAVQTSFLNLAKLLGTNGIVRIGGITSDTASAPGLPALTQPIANGLATFLAGLGSGWTTIYGLDACDNSAAHALSQATFIINAVGVANVVFQVGNEPPFEVCGFSQGTWTTTFEAYRTSILGTFATAKFAGPDVTNNSTVQSFVNGTTPWVAGLTYITTHFYPYGIGFSPVPDQLTSSVYNNDTITTVNSFAFQSNSVYAGNNKLMMTEGSSRAGCGLQGVTDRLMTSAWYLDLAMSLANDRWAGFQPHNAILTCFGQAHNGYYDPFVLQGDGTFAPSPMFYGMYLFSKVEGQVTATATKTGTANVKSIATIGTGGNANLLMQNNGTTFPVKVTPAQSAAWTTATVLLLSGANCYDASPTLGGQPIQKSGVWTGAASTINNGDSILIPPCGAALVKMGTQ
jgi:hypothetical protein